MPPAKGKKIGKGAKSPGKKAKDAVQEKKRKREESPMPASKVKKAKAAPSKGKGKGTPEKNAKKRKAGRQPEKSSQKMKKKAPVSPRLAKRLAKDPDEESEEEEPEMLLAIPAKKNRDPDITEKAYRRHVENNKVRKENDLKATDTVERSEQDLEEETVMKRLEYDALLTAEVKRFLLSHHIEKGLSQLDAKQKQIHEVTRMEITKREVASSSLLNGHAKEEGTGEEKQLKNDMEKENLDVATTEKKIDVESQDTEKAPKLSEEEIDLKWKEFMDEGFFEKKRIEYWYETEKSWYAAKIDELKVDGEKASILPPHFEKAVLKIHFFGFKKTASVWLPINASELTLENLRGGQLLAPPYVKTDGKKFPKQRRKKKSKRNETDSDEEGPEEATEEALFRKSWGFDACGVDTSNIVEFKRNRKSRESYVPIPIKVEEEEDDLMKYSDDVCALCGEHFFGRDVKSNEELLICEAGCNKVYHAPCLELEAIPDKLVCNHCQENSHPCISCLSHHYGEEDEPEEDSVQCSYIGCARYFHPTCIRDREDRARILFDPEDPDSEENADTLQACIKKTELNQDDLPKRLLFLCPNHCCKTCFQREEDEGKAFSGRLHRCLGCQNSFHERCIPYGSFRNDLGLFCHQCAREFDPPCSKEMKFYAQVMQRKNMMTRLDYTRFFQALELKDDSLFRLPPSFLEGEEMSKKNATKKGGAAKPRRTGKVPKYGAIKRNAYSSGCKPVVNKDTFEQMCKCSSQCGEDCLNRQLRIECFESNCSAKGCRNKMFQNMEYKKFRPVETPGRGWGLEICENAETGDFIIEYVGEVIPAEEGRSRLKKHVAGTERHIFQMDLGNDQIIDARYKGNPARFINHSCEPNCVLHKWNVRGVTRIGIFAKRDIAPGEELSFDYSFDRSSELDFMCLCGAPNCRGTFNNITSKESLAQRELKDLGQRIKTFKRVVKQERGGVLNKRTLKKYTLNSFDFSRHIEERDRRSRRVAQKTVRQNIAKNILGATTRITRDRFSDLASLPNKPFLLRNLLVGKNFTERLYLRESRKAGWKQL